MRQREVRHPADSLPASKPAKVFAVRRGSATIADCNNDYVHWRGDLMNDVQKARALLGMPFPEEAEKKDSPPLQLPVKWENLKTPPELAVLIIGDRVWGKAKTIDAARSNAGLRSTKKCLIYIVDESAAVNGMSDIVYKAGGFPPMKI